MGEPSKRLVWSVAADGAIKVGVFTGADAKPLRTPARLALLIEYCRNSKHLERVKSGDAPLASLQIGMTRAQARAIAALLTKAADEMDDAK